MTHIVKLIFKEYIKTNKTFFMSFLLDIIKKKDSKEKLLKDIKIFLKKKKKKDKKRLVKYNKFS